jgi:hypothetical protein
MTVSLRGVTHYHIIVDGAIFAGPTSIAAVNFEYWMDGRFVGTKSNMSWIREVQGMNVGRQSFSSIQRNMMLIP